MNLIQLQPNIFVDPATLSFVRFENLEHEPTATLRFQDGGDAEVLTGDAALQLHLRLQDGENADQSPPLEPDSLNDGSESSIQDEHSVNGRTMKTETATMNAWSPQRNKAWYYRKDDQGREYFHAFVNAKGSCSVRSFDFKTGVFLGKEYEAGNYQDRFSKLVMGAVKVTVKTQPNLELYCKERLPDAVFTYLRKQVSACVTPGKEI